MTPHADFTNEPLLELRRAEVREQLLAAARRLEQELPLRADSVVGGRPLRGTEDAGPELLSCDPGEPALLVARASRAGVEQAEQALAVAERAAFSWAQRSPAERAEALRAAAAHMRECRLELAALAVRECAKPWSEADADVAEAIDYLEYYARGALGLGEAHTTLDVAGERNTMRYSARGVCVVIAPWNFPLAIPCGMVGAALATGNAVILKPAEQSPGCGAAVVEALHAGGVPADVLALLQGEGDVGAALVADARVQTIAFTGSAAAGQEILQSAARLAAGQRHVKRVVAEMGGKNCVLLDSDADLDEAVPAIIRSAFAFAGQKCSAAARVLVHEALAEQAVERLAGAVATLAVGQAGDFATDVPPLIDAEAQERVLGCIERGAAEGHLAAQAPAPEGPGWFAPPTLITGLPPSSPLLEQEVFGPVLTVEAVADLDDALARVEALPYALTGGLFARNPATVARVAARSPVGNLYVNRAITGAMVGRQPFGGNRLSGTGVKAGGPDYLLQFVDSHVLSENVTRHGLVV